MMLCSVLGPFEFERMIENGTERAMNRRRRDGYQIVGFVDDRAFYTLDVILGPVPRICNRLILFNVIRSSAQGRG
ncbi:hypothetical protein AGR6A_Cc20020 [Agrobacterium sp. NCPPB 925]|nr:hypothetical protein AGR6A_Cc20020 [Agrobacterium sp. NCPPB 925]